MTAYYTVTFVEMSNVCRTLIDSSCSSYLAQNNSSRINIDVIDLLELLSLAATTDHTRSARKERSDKFHEVTRRVTRETTKRMIERD